MYYESGMLQAEIARQMGLSQATVSRLLARSREEGIVHISIKIPHGVYTGLEDSLILKFGLQEAIVVDCLDEDEKMIQRELGAAAAYYLESIVRPHDVVGLSSWSATLLALVDAMHPLPRKMGVQVVQILGGVGNPAAETHATRLTARMAQLLNGEAVYLPLPGVVSSDEARDVLIREEYAQEALCLFPQVTIALVGIGAVTPSPLLAQSGNVFTRPELDLLQKQRAAGDILLRFFDGQGRLVSSGLDNRVISMRLEQLKQVRRAIGIAGGRRKFQAILGALRGGWVNTLITDRFTAERLAQEVSFSTHSAG
jgi:DNA-binding transcriptional regulator LsrR (DeoR family)